MNAVFDDPSPAPTHDVALKRPRSLFGAALGAVALAAVAILVALAGRSGDLGHIHACLTCSIAGQPLSNGWLEVPRGDAWALALDDGIGAVVRGPARFELAGRPGRRVIALSAGVLYGQVSQPGSHLIVLLHGASAANEAAGTRIDADAQLEGVSVRAGAGAVQLELREGHRTLAAKQTWQSAGDVALPPSPDVAELKWLDQAAASKQ